MIVQNFPNVGHGYVSSKKLSCRILATTMFIAFALFPFRSQAQITINGSGSYATISAAVAAASAGDVIDVPPGNYNENVLINKQNLTLRSTGGKAVTTIQGITTPGAGAVMVANGINGVKIGQAGKGFTIIGFDGNGAIESAALYLLGAHTNITIEGNEIRANGDHGLLSNFNAAIDGITIKGNDFTGQTFLGSSPGDCGFGTQFNIGNNVPRQLVTMGGGATVTNSKNVYFLNNNVTGTAGGYNGAAGCTVFGQGNNLVTIDVIGCLISGNTFNGVTTRFGYSLRTRGPGASIKCNTFYSGGLAASCSHIFLGTANPLAGADPSTLAGIAAANGFPNGGAYLTPNHPSSYQIYLNNAQATSAATTIGASQSVVNCSSTTNCPVQNINTGLLFSSIQSAINDASTLAGHTISAGAGTYNEDITINKSITLIGSGCGNSIISGPIGGGGATIQVGAGGVIVDGFTITRDGNNPTDWNAGLNTAGVAIQGLTNNAEIRNCCITGNRTGIDINNSNGNNIHNNLIDNNRTGLLFRNQTDNTNLQHNFVTNNWTIGVLFIDASSGTNSPVQSAVNCTFNNNNISGNWYGQVQDRQTGGALPAPGSNLKNFTCNWYGSTSISTSSSNSSEPGYAAQIPVAFGGTATAPGGQPDILGTAVANITYITYLTNGTDNQPATFGFQPVAGSCSGDPVPPTISCPNNIITNNTPGQCGTKVCYPWPTVTDNLPPATPSGYTYLTSFGNSHYYRSTGITNYYTAESNAIAAGGRLATITSAAENNALNATGVGFSWIGGNDLEINGVWKWANCENFSFSNFCSGEPNGGSFENHLEFVTSGCWNDLAAGAGRYSILELQGATLVQTAGLPQNAFFPVGTTTNTFKATDAGGNTSFCSFTVTVVDNQTPSLIGTLPSGQTGMDLCKSAAPTGPTIADIAALYSDNCSVIVSKTGSVSGTDCSWSVTYTYDVHDGNGNHVSPMPTVTYSGGDTTAPTALAQNVTVTLSNGTATVTAAQVNNGSSDACSGTNVSLSLSDTSFTCADIGSNQVTLTVTDACNNSSTTTATVTVVGSIPTVSIAEGILPDFCQGGVKTLTANGTNGVTYLWSPGSATSKTINVSSSGTYTVTVTNGNGCTATASYTVTVSPGDLLSSYVILSTDEVKLHKNSIVQTGGVGSSASPDNCKKKKGKIKVENNSTITGSSTFARAMEIEVKSGSTVTTQYDTAVTTPYPSFKYHPYKNSGNNVNVSNGSTVTLNDTIYKEVNIGSNATVTFTASKIYLKKLQSNTGSTIKFSNCAVVIIDDKLDIGKNNQFNPDGYSAVVYVEKKVDVDEGSTVKGAIYGLEEFHTKGKVNARVSMTGQFIANDFHSDYTTWNWSTNCGGCTFNKMQNETADNNIDAFLKQGEVELKVFPNPSNGAFNIELNTTIQGELNITVYNYLGQQVRNISRPEFDGLETINIDLSNEASTYYIVKVEMPGQTMYRKVIIAK